MSEIENQTSLGEVALLGHIKPKYIRSTISFDFGSNGESFIYKIIGQFCHLWLMPFFLASNFEGSLMQRFIIFIYLLLLIMLLYKIITSWVIPVKTIESTLFIKCIIYWIFFLIIVMFLLNNFNNFIITDYVKEI